MSHALGPPPGLDLSALPVTPWLHRIDPRSRILAASLFALLLVSCQKIEVLLIGLLFSLALVLMARLPLLLTFKRTLGVDLFIIFLLALLPFTTPGEVWFTIGSLTASWEGFIRAVEIGLTAMSVILTLLALVGTLEPQEIGHALYRLKISEKFVHILLFTVRYLDVLRQEYRRLRQSMKARAFVPKSNLHTWRTYGYLVGMLLIRSLDRSERIMNAMKCRGFTGRFHLIDQMQMTIRDLQFGLLFVAISVLLIVGELR